METILTPETPTAEPVAKTQEEKFYPNPEVKPEEKKDDVPQDLKEPEVKEEKKEDKVPEKKEPEAKPVVPENYDLKLPENALIKAEQLEKIATYSKEQGFSQEQAQALVERENQVVKDFVEQQREQLGEQATAWMEACKTDKEFGGQEFKQNVELSERVIKKFGSDALKKGLNDSGLGNHPELVRMLTLIGKVMANDTLITGQTNGIKKEKAVEDLFYPDQKKE